MENYNEEAAIQAYLDGEFDESEDELDIATNSDLHNTEKRIPANRRKADKKIKKAAQNKPVTLRDEIFRPATAKEKKFKKRATSKKNRRSSEMVNSQRGLNHKVYRDINDIVAAEYGC